MRPFPFSLRVTEILPVTLLIPFLMGASGGGCEGSVFVVGEDAGADTGAEPDASPVCTPASCAGLAAPALAKVCPDGTTLTANVCEDQGGGRCAWGFPACPTDACASAVTLPCAPCPYGSTGTAYDANGCPTCPLCNPPPDSGACTCGAPPPIPACSGGGSPGLTCEPTTSGACSWVVGSCPTTQDAGGVCTSDADCAGSDVCGFPETGGCGVEGVCFPAPQVTCNAFSPGCACDGSEVNVICNGLPSGYAGKPLKHSGPCVDGG